MNATSVTFIGHQSWLVEVGGARVLVDPVLTDSFGFSSRLRFEIYPSRRVDPQAMPQIDAVCITNEHLDHYHLPSLSLLPPDVRVFMPRMMPRVCVEMLQAIDRKVELLMLNETTSVNDAEICFLPGGPGAPGWENRVACLYIRSQAYGSGGVFIQSDTAVSAPPSRLNCTPDIFIATHNGQIPPAGYLGAFDNMLPVGESEAAAATGLRMLASVLHQSSEHFDSVRYVAFSGGGYTQVPPKHGEFLWADFEQLANAATRLSLTTRVLGLTPGRSATISDDGHELSDVDWIAKCEPSVPVAGSNPEELAEPDVNSSLHALFEYELSDEDRAHVGAELAPMAPFLMQSALGRHLITQNTYLGHATGPHRFVIHLRGYTTPTEADDGTTAFALNMNNGQFEKLDRRLRNCLFTIPSGIDVNAGDLLAVMRGRIHVWELAVSRMRQWYLCGRFDSPVGFLYGYYSEQARPDLARELYRNQRASV
jgi:hypothetical protein